MVCSSNNFRVASYTSGFTLWSYSSSDSLEEIMAPGYFNPMAAYVRRGDMILTNADWEKDLTSAILVVTDTKDGNISLQRLV